jgi:hypothetical protein
VTGLSSSDYTAIFIQAVIVLVIARRSYAMSQGVPFSRARLVLVPILILTLWGVSELESIFLTPWALPYLIVLDVAILAGTSLGSTPVAERMTSVGRDAAGNWTYRIGFSLAALFLLAFVARLALAIALFPNSLQFGAPANGYPPAAQQAVLAVIDAIFSVSAGLLVGRSLGVLRKWNSAPSSPNA